MAGHLLLRGLLHGIRRNSRVSSLSRCRKLRCRHPRGLRHRPIDRLSSLSLAASLSERPAPGGYWGRCLSRQEGGRDLASCARRGASAPNIERGIKAKTLNSVCGFARNRAWRVGSLAASRALASPSPDRSTTCCAVGIPYPLSRRWADLSWLYRRLRTWRRPPIMRRSSTP
jgi:hypothetical protein